MKLNVQVYIILIFLSASCNNLRQEVNPKGIVQEPEKLVIACFISPQDTILSVRITRSFPLLGTSKSASTNVTNARVTLTHGSRSVVLPISSITTPSGMDTLYQIKADQLPIVAGQTYILTVEAPDGRLVRSTCTVPGPVPLETLTLDSALITESTQSHMDYYARLRWRDPAGQVNFYRVAGYNESTYTYSIQPPGAVPRDTTVRYWLDWLSLSNSNLTDQGQDGQLMHFERVRLSFVYVWINGQQQLTRPKGDLKAYLLNVDENYYRYHYAIERNQQVSDNPFSEPVLIPTNIQGGLGCFGAYNRSVVAMQLK